MNIVTGCSGVDAIAYIAELLDIELIGQIEIDDFCNKILELRYPGVKRYKDIFDVRGDEFGTVDIFAFGDPCQPHSVAGKQKGTADERYIWPEIFRIIKTMRPAWIINENVVGSVSNGVVLGKIMQLESEGYRARAFVIPACSVGAPHQRYRVFIVAHRDGCRYMGGEFEKQSTERRQQTQSEFNRCDKAMAYSCIQGLQGREDTREKHGKGQKSCNKQSDGCNYEREGRKLESGVGRNVDGLSDRLYGFGGQEDSSGVFTTFEAIFTATLEQILWPAGYGAEQYDYEPPRVATGVKNRTNRLKALGNAIVWPQIFPILLAIKLINEAHHEPYR
jgi:DNA (cytosine-5)-methyltransferase 1